MVFARNFNVRKNNFIEQGINTIEQINNTDNLIKAKSNFTNLSESGVPHVDADKLHAFVNAIQYPFIILILTFQPAIPLFKTPKPYERIPFLYSLHYKEKTPFTTF